MSEEMKKPPIELFGRKEILTPVESITKDNLVEVLGKALTIHEKNSAEIDYLYRYTRGTVTKTDTTTKVMYWTRQVKHLGTLVACAAGTDGIESTVQGTNLTSTACYVRFGFCI